MNSRRKFIRNTATGVALAGFGGAGITKAANSNIDPSLNSYWHEEGLEIVRIKVTKPLFCPYQSLETPEERGGGNHYYRTKPFTHNPFTIPAAGMSGSPVIIDATGKFIGFMTTFGYENSTFNYNGVDTLTISVPKGQELFIEDEGDGNASWKKYNQQMMERLNIKPHTNHPKFWADIEYCTWVEQKFHSKVKRGQFMNLNHDFIKKYIKGIEDLDYPKGKLTLDHGWAIFPDGTVDSGYGSWEPDPKKFPDFRKTMDLIQEKGFTPGLWIGFPKIHKESLIAKSNPNMLGQWNAINNLEKKEGDVRYLNPKADIYDYASQVIGRFVDLGVRKFKIDMSYNIKSDMLHIHKELYKAAKNIDPDIEMEFHVPDIFFAKYADVIRTNDIWITDKYDWKGRVKTHYEVASKSCPGRGINLDHIGGNAEWELTESRFLDHLELYKGKTGYPCVSIIPSHISNKCIEKTGEYLWEYSKGNKLILSEHYE